MPQNSLEILSENLKGLMASSAMLKSQNALSKKSGVNQRTIGRTINQENWPTLDTIDQLARVFRLQSWQLLAANLGASHSGADPEASALTPMALEVAQKLDAIPDQRHFRVAYMLVGMVLDLEDPALLQAIYTATRRAIDAAASPSSATTSEPAAAAKPRRARHP